MQRGFGPFFFKLAMIRNNHTLWIPGDVDTAFQKYEKNMLEMDASALLVDIAAKSSQHSDAVGDHSRRMYERFCQITGIEEWNGAKVPDQLMISNLMRELREKLGTNEFSTLRRATARLALEDITRARDL